jgi:hypothetical protein
MPVSEWVKELMLFQTPKTLSMPHRSSSISLGRKTRLPSTRLFSRSAIAANFSSS